MVWRRLLNYKKYVYRYLLYDNRSGGDTSFNLMTVDSYTKSGSYVITGKYRGVPFTSDEIIIP